MRRGDGDPCGELRKMLAGRKSIFKLGSVTPDVEVDADIVRETGGRREVLNKNWTGRLIQYADDIMFLIRRNSVAAVNDVITGAYEVLANWFLKSKLKLNSDKTHFMHLVSPQ